MKQWVSNWKTQGGREQARGDSEGVRHSHRGSEGFEERGKKEAGETDRGERTYSIGSQHGPGVISSPHEKCMLGYGITSKGG